MKQVKISELIKQLKEIKEKHGDVKVYNDREDEKLGLTQSPTFGARFIPEISIAIVYDDTSPEAKQ